MLNEKAIKDFQIIYKKRYMLDISLDEAMSKGQQLLELFYIVYKPIPKEDSKMIEIREEELE